MNTWIVYYSYSGITRRLAEEIALLTEGQLLELLPIQPYSFSYHTAVKEIRQQIEKGVCPALTPYADAVRQAERVFIGSPNWLKTFAPPVLTFLRAMDWKGKEVIPFCTHGGGGFGRMQEDMRNACAGAVLREGLACTAEHSFADLEAWLRGNGCV